MKFFLEINKEKEPSVTVVCGGITKAVEQIEKICKTEGEEQKIIYGYCEDEIYPLQLSQITRFFTLDGKVWVSAEGKKMTVKQRIKDLEQIVDEGFLKINQGCIVNVHKIKKFDVSIGGALKIVFKDGESDYVSRRELKNVKRRFGI